MSNIDTVIGIDTGVNTGVSCYSIQSEMLVFVDCMKIHEAMRYVYLVNKSSEGSVFVRAEDSRKRKWFGNSGKERLKGAGSVCRDAKIWEDFLTDFKIPFEMVAPKDNVTKLNAATFKKVTGWKGKTNEHGRDAAMLCYKFNSK